MKPEYWKTRLNDIDNVMRDVKKGIAEVICKSPGGRNIYIVRYGNTGRRCMNTANYSSACGAMDVSSYKRKNRPCAMLIGAVHGNEPEGIAAILNLISMIETGKKLDGAADNTFKDIADKMDLLLIPCANPDGRSRVPFESFVGVDFETFRYYSQGTWKNGELCNWPDCKKVHPILNECDYLGGYFDDNGVNIMHDNFFNPMSQTTSKILEAAEKYAADFTIQLHGGDNCTAHMIQPAYTSGESMELLNELALRVQDECDKASLPYTVYPTERREGIIPPPSFNFASAIHHVCGCASAVHECNQGISDKEGALTYEEIFKEHMILFKELFDFCIEKFR